MSWFRLVLIVSIAALQHAAAKIDLSRVTPPPVDMPIPIEDFFRPLLLRQPTMNPAGTHVAAIVTADEDQQHLLVHDLKTLKNEFFVSGMDEDVYWLSWAGDSRVIFNASTRKLYGLGLFGVEVGNIREHFPILQSYGARMIAIPPGDRTQPLVWVLSDRERCAAVINTRNLGGRFGAPGRSFSQWFDDARKTDREHFVQSYPEPEPGITYRYLADRKGHAAFAFNAVDGNLSMFRLEGKQWVRCPIDLERFDVIDAGDDAGTIVVRAPKGDGKPRTLHLMNAATGELGEMLFQDSGYDFDGRLFRTRATNEIVGAIFDRDGPRTVWFTEEYQALQKILNGFFPGMVVRIIESNDAETVFLVAVFSDRQPVVYNIVDLEKRSVGLFKNSSPWIDPKRMQPMNVIKFKTRDGRRLDAYLTLPAGASKEKPVPLVVIPHGGPFTRDTWGFDAETQFLASRGYAVLKPNYRGSTGYGWMFTDEEEWDFLEMHEDVTAATKAVAASGYVEADRIAIMGGSFGGYLAISGVANEPELYRCAVTIAGVFDWERHIKEEKYFQYDSPQYGRMIRKLGDPKTQREKFDAISPVRRADRIRVPVFVAGGKEDLVVEISQSKVLLGALEKHGVPHERMLVREEGHGMAHLENQIELYNRITDFLSRHMAKRKSP